ncbi:unnamed protein product [Ostreobium quekettii]|uniref:Uncharacterized protein n=1 Tax=Ostreobium quekettii TaxID=121088 RepID=A0A8S1JB29_9CHLO|nr:unnamed protein product [Ostreobium quekettii]|eukprot:evm.model.scf_358EXC.6 EVM.evm.TU.scf_358EXC.6   scf_358EXC:75723-81789(-)
MASADEPPPDPAGHSDEDETAELVREALQEMKALRQACREPAPPKPVNEQEGAVLDNEWYDLLQRCVDSPEFLKKLESICSFATDTSTEGEDKKTTKEPLTEDEIMESVRESYIVVSRDDAVESMALIIASSVSKCPEAQKLGTKELHKAVVKACKDLKTSKLKSAWQWSYFLYRTVAVSYSAFQVFEHPWLMRAIASALWQVPRTMWGLMF